SRGSGQCLAKAAPTGAHPLPPLPAPLDRVRDVLEFKLPKAQLFPDFRDDRERPQEAAALGLFSVIGAVHQPSSPRPALMRTRVSDVHSRFPDQSTSDRRKSTPGPYAPEQRSAPPMGFALLNLSYAL